MMKSIRSRFASLRPLRLLVALCACAFLIFANAVPAFAAKSDPRQGEEQLLGIEAKSQEKALEQPSSRAETQAEANAGINEIQGAADKEKMYTPEKSARAGSVERNVQKSLEKVTGNR
jgi:hypothetical protein